MHVRSGNPAQKGSDLALPFLILHQPHSHRMPPRPIPYAAGCWGVEVMTGHAPGSKQIHRGGVGIPVTVHGHKRGYAGPTL